MRYSSERSYYHEDTEVTKIIDAFVTLSKVNLNKLYAIDPEFHLLAASEEGNKTFPSNKLVCANLLNKALQRRGAARLKPDSDLCFVEEKPTLAIIVPVGALKIQGYLLILLDPALNLTHAKKCLGTPLRISTPNNKLIYKSTHWPETLGKNILLANYTLQTKSGQPTLQFSFATNISSLQDKLTETRNLIFAIAAIVMLSTALVALIVLQRTAINPLNVLTRHLRRVQEDKSQLGKQIDIRGNNEISELATDFNGMSNELNALYRTLVNMAFTDTITGMANRALFYNRLEQATLSASHYHTEYALFMMDLNRFKNINDTLGHHIGDQLLQVVGKRLLSILRETDTVARLSGAFHHVL